MKKINKTTARRLFNQGMEITLIPCKCAVGSVWLTGVRISNSNPHASFDSIVNEFKYYNCCYELGYYPAYYIDN